MACCLQGLDKVAVAVRSRNLLATAFHPELTDDIRWYASFDLSTPPPGIHMIPDRRSWV